jgi:hypothetical protein
MDNMGKLKLKRWFQKANNRDKQSSVIKETKDFSGLYSHG